MSYMYWRTCDNDLDEELTWAWLGNGRVDNLDRGILLDKCFLHGVYFNNVDLSVSI